MSLHLKSEERHGEGVVLPQSYDERSGAETAPVGIAAENAIEEAFRKVAARVGGAALDDMEVLPVSEELLRRAHKRGARGFRLVDTRAVLEGRDRGDDRISWFRSSSSTRILESGGQK